MLIYQNMHIQIAADSIINKAKSRTRTVVYYCATQTILASISGLAGHQWNIPVESNFLGSSPGATLWSRDTGSCSGGRAAALGVVGL